MLTGIIVCIVFIILAIAMMTRKLPAILVMPIMAIAIALAAGMPIIPIEGATENILDTVLNSGASRLIGNVINVIFASWMANLLYKTGITDLMIKKAAELGGDKPVVVTILLILVTALLFSAMGGVGAVAMIGGTVLPILISVGVKPLAAAHLFMAALSAGYNVRPANIVTVANICGVQTTDITVACWILCVFDLLFAFIYLIVDAKKNGKKYAFAAPAEDEDLESVKNTDQVRGVRALLASLTPVIILACTYFFKWNVVACYSIGIIWAIIMTAKGGWSKYVSLVTQSAYDGVKDSAPPAIIFMGIGMILTSVGSSTVQTALTPFMQMIIPGSVIGLLIFCAVLSPLSLYRGPFNILGLGSCLAAGIVGLGIFDPVLLAAVFYCTFRWPAQACPTATQVVWVANYVGEEPVNVSNKVFIANWVMTAASVFLVGLLYSTVL
ncbi:MAG: hypothetical protein IJZ85_00725 [Lachnospiraceae bacterium]|nr:hypothetical protein [Lachnospiraceae bacterium]